MTPDDYSLSFTFDLQAFDLLSARSMQDDTGQIGASNFGCREQMRRILAQEPRTDSPDKTAAIIGTYIDAGVKQARKAANPALIVDAELPVTLFPHEQPEGFTFLVHPDEIDPDEPAVTDVKTKNGLAAIRRGFADPQYRMQRHLQALAAIQNKVLPETAIARNVYVDRSGSDPDVHVEQEPFSPEVIAEATEFLNDALYANKHGEEAPKDKPRTFCRDYCLGGETEVVTASGIRPISELAGGWHRLLIPVGHRNSRSSWRECEVRSFGVQRLWAITLKRGRSTKVVYATAEHRWRQQRGGPCRTSELRPGATLSAIRRDNTLNLVEVAPAVAQGFVFGDGSVSANPGGGSYAMFYDAAEKDKNLFPYFTPGNWRRRANGWHVGPLPRSWKRAPDFDESRSFLLSWLAGYFAADGSVSEGGQVVIWSARRDHIHLVRSICAVVGVGYGPAMKRMRTGYGESPTALWNTSLKLADLPPWFFIQRHHAERAEAARERRKTRTLNWRVLTVEPTDRVEEVFCAVVPGEEAFALSDGLVTMNCPFNTACRGPEIDIEPITDDRVAAMVRAYGEADTQEKSAGQLRKELREQGLAGLSGRTADGWTITSTWVNAKNPYYRVAVEGPVSADV